MSERLGHGALIDRNPRRGEKIVVSPAEALRDHERSAVERVNRRLHDEYGGRHVRVRGPVKFADHLAFGLMVIAAEQMLKMLGSPGRGLRKPRSARSKKPGRTECVRTRRCSYPHASGHADTHSHTPLSLTTPLGASAKGGRRKRFCKMLNHSAASSGEFRASPADRPAQPS